MRYNFTALTFCLFFFVGCFDLPDTASETPNIEEQSQTTAFNHQPTTDGTMFDAATGLTWFRCHLGQTWQGTACHGSATPLRWQDAISEAEKASTHSSSNWRLPTHDELSSISFCREGTYSEPYKYTGRLCRGNHYRQSIDLTLFPAGLNDWLWTASENQDNPAQAWAIHFDFGMIHAQSKQEYRSVMLVTGP